ncbi:MAG: inositol monophosphatase [Candidatus Zixiibacteriota bacterium]|nr:MAG: inositol monophosphatase [candidate division Zixibacteria bacterium]
MKEYRKVATEAALKAGELLVKNLNKVKKVDHKGVVNLVTDIDRKSERLIHRILRSHFPNHSFFAEEEVREKTSSDYLWTIDPLDGTTNYAHGFPIFCVTISLLRKEEVIMGLTYDPMLGEMFYAERGAGAFLNRRRIQISRTEDLNDSLLATGFPYDLRESEDDNLDYFCSFVMKAQAVRRAGSAALDLAYTACGRFDGFWEFKLGAWDIAAGCLLVEEAGGRVTNFKGRRVDLFTGEVLASNGKIHDQMLKVLKDTKKKQAANREQETAHKRQRIKYRR